MAPPVSPDPFGGVWTRLAAPSRSPSESVLPGGTTDADYAVDAYLTVAGSLERPELRGRAWNAGCGSPVPVREVVDRLVSVSGLDLEPDLQGAGTPHGEIDRQYLDSTVIEQELGWRPKVSLDEGLRATWEWYRDRLS